jgi:hypothetical protein
MQVLPVYLFDNIPCCMEIFLYHMLGILWHGTCKMIKERLIKQAASRREKKNPLFFTEFDAHPLTKDYSYLIELFALPLPIDKHASTVQSLNDSYMDTYLSAANKQVYMGVQGLMH